VWHREVTAVAPDGARAGLLLLCEVGAVGVAGGACAAVQKGWGVRSAVVAACVRVRPRVQTCVQSGLTCVQSGLTCVQSGLTCVQSGLVQPVVSDPHKLVGNKTNLKQNILKQKKNFETKYFETKYYSKTKYSEIF
jgi:hypothetical protein